MRIDRCIGGYLVVAATLLASHDAAAQAATDSIGPRRGTWGVEASYGSSASATLLRFSSPRAAWMLGASFVIGQETSDEPLDFVGNTTRSTHTLGIVELRAGRRWWTGGLNEAMRPFVGLGLGGRYANANRSRQTAGSLIGELGATYFFGSHVSLGGAGELSFAWQRDRYQNTTGALTNDSWFVRSNLARLNAAVYF
ncbi:MAG: hypothetical protein ACJ8AD_13160 [Gemmatimonadaceae bacterium]